MKAQELVELAKAAREKAYAPYSSFKVGAALLGESGQVYLGCNIENASFGATNCAERTAIFKGISEGESSFTALAVVADTEDVCMPCGICRQVLTEFINDQTEIYLANLKGKIVKTTISQLMPNGFTKTELFSNRR
ncbi:MAG: cytidine deaminase [Firmicutes bacterium]|nr:cytidine deaminase [Bacillota bacterium]